MKIVDDSPPVLSALDRPNSYIGRSVPRPNLARLTQGRGQYVSDVDAAAHGACRLRALAARACAHRVDRHGGGEEGAGRDRRRHRRGARQGDHALGRRAHPSQGHQVGAAARHRGRPRLLAGRGGVRRGRAHARRGRGRLRAGRGRLRGTARGHRSGDRARCRHAGDPSRARRQSHLRAHARRRRVRTRASPSADAVVETTFVFGRHTGVTQRAARHRRRLESGRAAPDRLSGHAGAAHDAEPVRQASRRSKSIRSASSPRTSAARSASRCTPMPTRWRRSALSKLLKRPVKFVADRIESFVTDIHARDHRVKAQDRRQERRHHHRLRDRRSHRHRPLFGLSAHQSASRPTRSSI